MDNLFKEATNTYNIRRGNSTRSKQVKPKHNVHIIIPDYLEEIDNICDTTKIFIAPNETINTENDLTVQNCGNTLLVNEVYMEEIETVSNKANIVIAPNERIKNAKTLKFKNEVNALLDEANIEVMQTDKAVFDPDMNVSFGTDTSENNKIEDHDLSEMNLTEGQVLCGKVGNYPWWPCMVNVCPNGKVVQNSGKGEQILVSYFGIIRNYNYLGYKNILNFQTEQELNDYIKVQFEILGKKKAKRLYMSTHKGSQALKLAWQEAEEALKVDIKERIEKYGMNTINKKAPRTHKPRRKPNRPNLIQVVPKPPATVKEKRVIKKPELTFAFTQLMMPYHQLNLALKCCRYCLEMGEVVNCESSCETYFHSNCLQKLKKSMSNSDDRKKCMECTLKIVRCYYCWETVDIEDTAISLRCSIASCGKWYHRTCVTTGSMNEMTKWETAQKLICPRHLCHKCELVSPYPKYKVKKLTMCLMCCATYHTGDWCIPAGSVELSDGEIICPRHLIGGKYSQSIVYPPFVGRVESKVQKTIFKTNPNQPANLVIRENIQKAEKPANVNWCFQCGHGGVLLCCETCPAAYHFECSNEEIIPDHFYCVDCRAYCYRCYGEVVWIKFGVYRWWPGQILHSSCVPDNIMAMEHESGDFVVQFFGSREYSWSDQGKVFQYEADDENNMSFAKRQKFPSYFQGVKEAAEGFRLRNQAWYDCSAGHVMGASKFTKILTNKYSTSSLALKRTKSNHQCDCTPKDPGNNCGLQSNCINKELKYECDPKLCLMKDKCQNQNFTRRNYPMQEVFWSGECGWGLKTLESISRHQFVNEYVGEIISIEESKERTKFANSNKCSDFYYMELDNYTLLDARNYANVSRFINHSCDPNLKAEKWIVNGEDRVGLFALRNIEIGEELTFNYRLYNQTHNNIPCKCNSKNCSGFLGDGPKKHSSPRKILKARMKSLKMVTDESESVSKQSASTSSVSFTTEKYFENTCFRCSEMIDELKDIACAAPGCPKIYHAKCLHLDMNRYNKLLWICPWHHCDTCGRLSVQHCPCCTSSVCQDHILNIEYPCSVHGITDISYEDSV